MPFDPMIMGIFAKEINIRYLKKNNFEIKSNKFCPENKNIGVLKNKMPKTPTPVWFFCPKWGKNNYCTRCHKTKTIFTKK